MTLDDVEPSSAADEDRHAAPCTAGDGLQEGLLELSWLGGEPVGLHELLTRVGGCAVRAIRGAEGAGVTLLEEDRRTPS